MYDSTNKPAPGLKEVFEGRSADATFKQRRLALKLIRNDRSKENNAYDRVRFADLEKAEQAQTPEQLLRTTVSSRSRDAIVMPKSFVSLKSVPVPDDKGAAARKGLDDLARMDAPTESISFDKYLDYREALRGAGVTLTVSDFKKYCNLSRGAGLVGEKPLSVAVLEDLKQQPENREFLGNPPNGLRLHQVQTEMEMRHPGRDAQTPQILAEMDTAPREDSKPITEAVRPTRELSDGDATRLGLEYSGPVATTKAVVEPSLENPQAKTDKLRPKFDDRSSRDVRDGKKEVEKPAKRLSQTEPSAPAVTYGALRRGRIPGAAPIDTGDASPKTAEERFLKQSLPKSGAKFAELEAYGKAAAKLGMRVDPGDLVRFAERIEHFQRNHDVSGENLLISKFIGGARSGELTGTNAVIGRVLAQQRPDIAQNVRLDARGNDDPMGFRASSRAAVKDIREAHEKEYGKQELRNAPSRNDDQPPVQNQSGRAVGRK
jgi:hypothetical protein